nr:MAG TPA: 43 kDa tail protein [Caudoviricetes sp.]
MNLEVFYSDPPSGASKNIPITSYVTAVTWSGSIDQAARKVEFCIAYNTPNKDSTFVPIDVKLGGIIDLYYSDDGQPRVQIFSGKVFFRKRNTAQFSYDVVCYDNMIFLAKNKIQKKFTGVTLTEAIKQVCNEAGIEVGETPSLEAKFNYIADAKSCTEVLKKISETNVAAGGKVLTAYCNLGKVIVTEKGSAVIEGYIASDALNIAHTEHSESIENMVNRVVAVNATGNVVQTYQDETALKEYGVLQDVFKLRPVKGGETVDNAAEAKSKLHGIESDSSLEGLGNIQCITGYTIKVQEEQLQGLFFIKSDTHKFEDGKHTMTLSLDYVEEGKDEKE